MNSLKRDRGDCPAMAPARPVKLLVVMVLMLGSFGLVVAQTKDSCVECHSQLEGELGQPVGVMKADFHGSRGLSCADCHGGDSAKDDPFEAMDPRKGFIGRPAAKDIPRFCGKCHSSADFMKRFNPALRVDQESEYFTSVHGKRLRTGIQAVATCTSCHGYHGIRSISDPGSPVYVTNVAGTCAKCHSSVEHMRPFGIPTDQHEKYRKSAHATALYERQDLSAPTCNDCHGNHGAAPPGVTSVANVCGQCHARQSSLFQGSPHKAAFDLLEVGECRQCHGNHEILRTSDEMIGVGERATCTECHTDGDNGYEAAKKMRQMIDDLETHIASAVEVLDKAERAGMEVSKPKFELTEARDDLTHARVLIHAFSVAEVEGVVTPGLEVAVKSRAAGERALDELQFRRKGLGISLFFILFLATVIYLKIRQMEARNRRSASS